MDTETIDRLFLELSQVTQATTAKEIALQGKLDDLRAALLNCARQAEALKRDCSPDPESWQAVRNAKYQAISTTAHIALGTVRGPAP